MRITDRGTYTNYGNQLQKNSLAYNKAYNRVTGYAYDKMSDDVSTVSRVRTMETNKQHNEVYLRNIASAKDAFAQAETITSGISELLLSCIEPIDRAVNGTMGDDDRANMAELLRSYQEQIVFDLNSAYQNKYLFSGADTSEKPFVFDSNSNTLFFMGIDVSDPSAIEQAKLDKLAAESIWIDIGLGMQVTTDGSGANTVVAGTAFDTSFSALNFLGYGQDADGNPNNIVVLLGEIANMIDDPAFSHDKSVDLQNLFQDQYKAFVVNETSLHARASYLESTESRLTLTNSNITEAIAKLQVMDTDLAFVELTAAENAYLAALKVGPNLLGTSLLDYLG